jgi:hypothetical protein
MAYSPTLWTNRVTTLGPTNLNKLEQGVANAAAVADNAMSAGADAIPLVQKGTANGVSTLDASSKVPIAQIPSIPLSLLPAGTPTITYGTTPPVSPVDGDLWDFPADATNGVIWRFRYRAASASAYKWEFIGGPPLTAFIAADETIATANAWTDLPTVGPQVAVPRAGDYWAWGHVTMNNATAGTTLLLGITLNAGNPLDPLQASANAAVANYGVALAISGGRISGAATSDQIRMRYWANNANLHGLKRSISVLPIRVS